MQPFKEDYWRENYQDLKTIDGIGNVKDHSRYVQAYFNLEGFEPESLIDLGFGYGYLLKEFRRVFRPRRVAGIEPSPHAFKRLRLPGAQLHQEDLLSWAQNPARARPIYDLAICNSVLQYLSVSALKQVLPVMAQRCRYLYLTVPTDVEYERQLGELEFADKWAKVRSRQTYQRLLRPHFTFVSSRILESKVHFTERTTPFQDLLFRF